jgi:hypothetical protein
LELIYSGRSLIRGYSKFDLRAIYAEAASLTHILYYLSDQLMYHNAAVTTTELSHLEQGPTISVSQRTRDALLARGHDDLLDIDYAGTVQAVAVDFETNTLSAVSDIRKGGKPSGY